MIWLVLIAVALGAAIGYLAREREVRWLRSELGIANDRLYAAWNDGAKIPPRPEPEAPQAAEVPIPDYIMNSFISRYDSDEGQARARSEVLAMYSRGMKFEAIWMDLQRRYDL